MSELHTEILQTLVNAYLNFYLSILISIKHSRLIITSDVEMRLETLIFHEYELHILSFKYLNLL